MDTDRELLEWAAKAAGVKGHFANNAPDAPIFFHNPATPGVWGSWNPLKEDGDAFRLAVKLRISPDFEAERRHVFTGYEARLRAYFPIVEKLEGDELAATRRAIVRAAAELGKSAHPPKGA
jgi:hypothetical protein